MNLQTTERRGRTKERDRKEYSETSKEGNSKPCEPSLAGSRVAKESWGGRGEEEEAGTEDERKQNNTEGREEEEGETEREIERWRKESKKG